MMTVTLILVAGMATYLHCMYFLKGVPKPGKLQLFIFILLIFVGYVAFFFLIKNFADLVSDIL